MYLLDTVILSELRKRQRDPGVVAWVEHQRSTDLFVSVISIGEIERGIALQLAKDASFARALAAWLDRVLALYADRILPFDLNAARRWGGLSAAIGNAFAGLGSLPAPAIVGIVVVSLVFASEIASNTALPNKASKKPSAYMPLGIACASSASASKELIE